MVRPAAQNLPILSILSYLSIDDSRAMAERRTEDVFLPNSGGAKARVLVDVSPRMLLPSALVLLTHRRLPPPPSITMDVPWWNLWAEEPASPQVAATISGLCRPGGWTVRCSVGSEVARELGGTGTLSKEDGTGTLGLDFAVAFSVDEGFEPPQGSVLCENQGWPGQPARTRLPIGRGWPRRSEAGQGGPRLEAALNFIWRGRGVLEGELAGASGRLLPTQAPCAFSRHRAFCRPTATRGFR
jgi:hypothetical protein